MSGRVVLFASLCGGVVAAVGVQKVVAAEALDDPGLHGGDWDAVGVTTQLSWREDGQDDKLVIPTIVMVVYETCSCAHVLFPFLPFLFFLGVSITLLCRRIREGREQGREQVVVVDSTPLESERAVVVDSTLHK